MKVNFGCRKLCKDIVGNYVRNHVVSYHDFRCYVGSYVANYIASNGVSYEISYVFFMWLFISFLTSEFWIGAFNKIAPFLKNWCFVKILFFINIRLINIIKKFCTQCRKQCRNVRRKLRREIRRKLRWKLRRFLSRFPVSRRFLRTYLHGF